MRNLECGMFGLGSSLAEMQKQTDKFRIPHSAFRNLVIFFTNSNQR